MHRRDALQPVGLPHSLGSSHRLRQRSVAAPSAAEPSALPDQGRAWGPAPTSRRWTLVLVRRAAGGTCGAGSDRAVNATTYGPGRPVRRAAAEDVGALGVPRAVRREVGAQLHCCLWPAVTPWRGTSLSVGASLPSVPPDRCPSEAAVRRRSRFRTATPGRADSHPGGPVVHDLVGLEKAVMSAAAVNARSCRTSRPTGPR